MTPRWWTLLPVRGIATGKSRLAAVLDAPARSALNRHLLEHTLEVIGQWRGGLARCLVISPCAQALAAARDAGARILHEPAGSGLNAALALGAAQVTAEGAAKLLILACDLPDLSVAALDALAVFAGGAGDAALATDRAGSGTNALAIDAPARDVFRFGVDSRARHREALMRVGFRPVWCERPELAFDLDTPADYAEWLTRCGARIPRGLAPSASLPAFPSAQRPSVETEQ